MANMSLGTLICPSEGVAMPCDSSKTFSFGIPLGYALKGTLSKLPKEWAKTAWYGPTAIPTLQQQPGNLYHTVLLRSTALSMMVQAGKMRFLQQDRALVEDSVLVMVASMSLA
jgi:hypothetical protein